MNDEQLLDYFAGIALGELLKDDLVKPIDRQMGYKWAAEYSYKIAKVMLEAKYANNSTTTS